MSTPTVHHAAALGLMVGDLVEVRSEEEILATLDEHGALDGVPFMPEMLPFCGQRYRVYRRADKTCDAETTERGGHIRRMHDTVHLEGLRCDGSAHDGCQARCLMFWKEAWLRRVDGDGTAASAADSGRGQGVTRDVLFAATKTEDGGRRTLPIYSCQATEIGRTTAPLPWWEPTQYVRDVRSGNVNIPTLVRGLLILVFNKFQAANNAFFPRFKLIRNGRRYPFYEGRLSGRTPKEDLGLQPGELVEIKSLEEIEQTLDKRSRNRGMRFSLAMVTYTGQRARVLARVDKIIDEGTGEMVRMKSPSVILDEIVCTLENYQFCPRAIYPYWREIWLRRVGEPVDDTSGTDGDGGV
jgi:hypothetical protein